MEVLLFSSDLMGQPKIGDAAKAAGMAFRVAADPSKLLEISSGESIVVLDLGQQNFDVAEVIAQLRSATNPPRAILAFGPHVHEARLEAARAAGSDRVFARGQFLSQAAQIFRDVFGQ
jgi:hypothetical protein